MSVQVITFGCRLNSYESGIIKKNAQIASLVDTVIINSCAVTNEAEKKLRKTIKNLRKKNPNLSIILTGCAAQISPDFYKNFDGVDFVIGNKEKMQEMTYSDIKERMLNKGSANNVVVGDIMSVQHISEDDNVITESNRTRAFIEIQNGCNHRCTFCTIPFGRGNNRSVPLGSLVERVRKLVDYGYKEIILTGVDITDYGQDLPIKITLGDAIKRLLSCVPSILRLRLSSIDVSEIDEKLLRVIIEEEKLMPFFHISMQSGDPMILKRMKRRHSPKDVTNFCKIVREFRRDATFGADIITGFPTETDEHFYNTCKLIEENAISHLHVFPYSQRDGTPAAKMPQVPHQIRRERAYKLREIGDSILQKHYNKYIGQTVNVLFEKGNEGKTENNSKVCIRTLVQENTLLPVRVIEVMRDKDELKLLGEPL
ncbi:tRNA (N(6)-L-threonylcarbamoyladenosine(37)-C(2))-methylthiotransferase MtaB [Candidatus Fokinia crypta]|uniref:Threonylcarbamoyladenosine tRNA methylthiotransferase MtaB n=1 Tax=Candidatus Fokinia crypta TaxID=1920990 RepID=A0ABZ0USP8_9RICK|nr:tRNA (N(6)-L-threonylcarbamoyladenosine(37)-C(2))-methylthiotransferase MtaB [Candidatus Fokinia cryptica]WPX98178.1 Threonylcarbamoyladenosine tRNA methylthiotransferase MtaB [Candidatus Fokinia cryptica]